MDKINQNFVLIQYSNYLDLIDTVKEIQKFIHVFKYFFS